MCSDPTVITVIRHVIGKPEAVAAPGPALRAFICATAVFTIVLVLDLVHRLTIPLSTVTLHERQRKEQYIRHPSPCLATQGVGGDFPRLAAWVLRGFQHQHGLPPV